uniref:Erythroid differentiation-related factor 1 n=3 Tax=Wuchereria bancrofti TaxID=6293 RepID=A0AAF5PSW9_WUCBA
MAETPLPSTSASSPTINDGSMIAYNAKPILCLPSTIQPAPLPVVKLELNTNLNVPPLNAWSADVYDDFWTEMEDSSKTSHGKATSTASSGNFSGNGNRTGTGQWRFNTRIRDCFESLRLADCYIDAIVGGIDVIAEAETLKKLIAAPFSKQPLNLIVHKIGKTLLLDNCAYLKNYAYMNPPVGISSVADFLNSKSQCLIGIAGAKTAITTGDIIADMHRKMITESLYTRSLAPLDYTATTAEPDVPAQTNKTDENESSKKVNENGGLVDPLEDYLYTKIRMDDGKVELDAYGRLWNFYDLNMLVDVNLPIFGCKSNPCVTLHPKDLKQRPINFLTGVDLYLDQSMCNAPEALLCWHLGGYVKEYELIRTEDIPHLENSKFDPLILRNVAENIIAFLQDKVAQEGHTYWLCHDKGDSDREPMLRLWDLTPLCGNLLEDSTANPFTLSVGILIYKVARNLMRRSAHRRPKRIANAAFRLLNVCLGIIDRNKHPQIVACVYYLLANLYLSYGCDAVKRSAGQEEEMERAEPQWTYDDRWQREYGEEYASYAAISIESLMKTRYTVSRREKPPKLRTLPNCATKEDCCKEALEHCLEGLRYMDLFDQMEQEAQRLGKPLPDPMSFIRDMGTNIDLGREEADAMLKVDVRSILFIRAGSAYRMLADSSFVLSRYGRTLRFARVGLYCCLAVLALNAGLNSEHAQRNLATARALLPAMMCHIAEALGNIACSSLPVKDQAKADLKRCYRDKQIKAQALDCLNNNHDSYSVFSADGTAATTPLSSSLDDSGDNGSGIQKRGHINESKGVGYFGSTESDIQIQTNSFTAATVAVNLNSANCAGICDGSLAKICRSDKDRPYSWAFPKTFHMPFVELLAISERAADVAIATGKKIAPMSLFPPTADAILYPDQLARRLGNLKNILAVYHIERLKGFVQRAAQKGTKLFTDKETMQQYIAMDVNALDTTNDTSCKVVSVMEPEEMVERTVKAGKKLLLQGISLFGLVGDHVNEAFLLSNIGQLYRLQLHCQMYFTDFSLPYDPEKEKNCVLEAIEHYQRALTTIADFRGAQFPLFESISKDLAGIYLTYAVRLQDNVQPGMIQSHPEKMTVEIHEFLVRAQSAYTLIRNSVRCSPKMHYAADRCIIEILFRFGKLFQHAAQYSTVGLPRKLKDYERQAIEYYSACFNYVMGKITRATRTKSPKKQEKICLRECITALRATLESTKCSDVNTRVNTADARIKRSRRSLAALFVATQPLMLHLESSLSASEEEKKEFFEDDSLMHLNSYRETLHLFVQYVRNVVKDALQCLVARCNSKMLDLWKDIYRLLLQIQITGEGCSLSQCLLQLADCAKHVNSCFEKSEL